MSSLMMQSQIRRQWDREEKAVAALVHRAQRGDSSAFEQLYRAQVGRVYGLCLRLINDRVKAETLTQDVFVRAWQKLDTFAGSGSFAGWLKRIAVNTVMEDRRVAARRHRWLEPLEEATCEPAGQADHVFSRGGAAPMAGPASATAAEAAIDLQRAIAGLPAGARKAFVLHDVEGYQHREIAEMMGLATGTIKAQVHRARMLLRQQLSESRKAVGE